jgi:hypothetical protein
MGVVQPYRMLLRPRLAAFEIPDNTLAQRELLVNQAELLHSPQADRLKEQELLPDFLTDVFTNLLGYSRPTDNPGRYLISREKHVQLDGKFADATLGEFTDGRERFVIALEGKGPTDPLDRPFHGRKMSTVDQGYRYAINRQCDWIIVTSMRHTRMYYTAYFVSSGDPCILGVLSSWATWFMISKIAQPLRLRGNRWQYRLFTQFMEQLPVPEPSVPERGLTSRLAIQANSLGQTRLEGNPRLQQRLTDSFGEACDETPLGTLNKKAQAWSELPLSQLGATLKTSFKLRDNPFQSSRVADEWEPCLAEKKAEVERLPHQLADAEAELNNRVYHLFDLTRDEIQLLQREVEH